MGLAADLEIVDLQVPKEFWRRKYDPTWDPLRVRMEPRVDPDDPAAVAADMAQRRRGMVPCDPEDAWCTAAQVPRRRPSPTLPPPLTHTP